jgi:hypothetical protein
VTFGLSTQPFPQSRPIIPLISKTYCRLHQDEQSTLVPPTASVFTQNGAVVSCHRLLPHLAYDRTELG